jgi:indoleamine 2,3-dioxygenase
MTRMRKYMPGKHQEFLLHLASHRRPIRELARCSPTLRQPYDSVVLALKRFRDFHMRIACLYVVSMSRSAAAMADSGCPVGAMMETLQREEAIRKPVRGTGGNELSCLLKASRDATSRAVLKDNIN